MFNPNDNLIKLKGKYYLEVKWRLVWFREKNPNYGISTEALSITDDKAIFKAQIVDENGSVKAVAHGSETTKDFGDYIEKAETKAVGRALAYMGFGTQFAGTELDEGERIVDAPVKFNDAKLEPVGMIDANENPHCSDCGSLITNKVASYSIEKFGRALCYSCQKGEAK